MTDPLPTVQEAALRIIDALEKRGLAYALGGALAYNYWGDPRGTNDLDLTVFVAEEDYSLVVDLLAEAGCTIDPSAALARARDRGDMRADYRGVRVDVFVPSIPFYDSVRQRIRRLPFLGREACVLSAEDLTVFKMLFHRGKDIEDIKRMIALQGPALDAAYVRRWLVETVGESDARVPEWDRLVREYGPRG